MTAVAGRVWGWVSPAISYRPWASKANVEKPVTDEGQMSGSWGWGGLTSWVWGWQKKHSGQKTLTEEYWEVEEEKVVKSVEIEVLCAGKAEKEADTPANSAPRWWSRMLPSTYFLWPGSANPTGLRQRKCAGWNDGGWDSDNNDGEFSDYGTPPPSPTPLSRRSSPFQFFARSWKGEILPEHYDICFNFIRHLFDLFVVGFLWTVSPPAKVILEVLGVQGALKLWLHGMAMFFVSTVGMAGLLWLVQEYLAQFALAYGIVQALVISVSVRQSVVLGDEDELDKGKVGKEEEEKNEERQDGWDQDEQQLTTDKTTKE